jgi:hypothetical protein
MRQREEAFVDQIIANQAAQIKASQQLDRVAKIADGIRKDNNLKKALAFLNTKNPGNTRHLVFSLI